jgi:hypothetical protein
MIFRVDTLRKSEIDQVIRSVCITYVVQFNIPVGKSNFVKYIQCIYHLNSHFSYFYFELKLACQGRIFHVSEPLFVEVLPTMANHQLCALLLQPVSESHQFRQTQLQDFVLFTKLDLGENLKFLLKRFTF